MANVAALGGLPLPLGVVGDDESGQKLVAVLQETGIPTDGILVRPGYRTPTKTRILAGGHHSIKQQIVRFDIEEKQDLSAVGGGGAQQPTGKPLERSRQGGHSE